MQSLTEYIQEHYEGKQALFARAQGVKPQQVTQWINAGFTVDSNVLYSPRRFLQTIKAL